MNLSIRHVSKKKVVILIIVLFFIVLGLLFYFFRDKVPIFGKKISKSNNLASTDGEVPNIVDLNNSRIQKNQYSDPSEKLSDMESVTYAYYYSNELSKATDSVNQVFSTFPTEKIDISFLEFSGVLYKKKNDKNKANYYFDLALNKLSTIPEKDRDEVKNRINSEKVK